MENNNLKPGIYILHCKGKRLISKLIKFFTKSAVTHTALALVESDGSITIYDSQNDGFNARSHEQWKEKFNYDVECSVTPATISFKLMCCRIDDLKGMTSYDFRLFFLRYPIKIVKSWITGKDVKLKSVNNEDEKMICSESVAYVMGLSNPEEFTPKALHEYCMKNKHSFILWD